MAQSPPIPPVKILQWLAFATIGMFLMAAITFALACASAALLTWLGHRWSVTPLNKLTWRELGRDSILPSAAAAYLLLRVAVKFAAKRRRTFE